MLFGTFPVDPELQLRSRALKRAVNPSVASGATGLNRGEELQWEGMHRAERAERADPSGPSAPSTVANKKKWVKNVLLS